MYRLAYNILWRAALDDKTNLNLYFIEVKYKANIVTRIIWVQDKTAGLGFGLGFQI